MSNINIGVNGYYAKWKQKGSEFRFYERLKISHNKNTKE